MAYIGWTFSVNSRTSVNRYKPHKQGVALSSKQFLGQFVTINFMALRTQCDEFWAGRTGLLPSLAGNHKASTQGQWPPVSKPYYPQPRLSPHYILVKKTHLSTALMWTYNHTGNFSIKDRHQMKSWRSVKTNGMVEERVKRQLWVDDPRTVAFPYFPDQFIIRAARVWRNLQPSPQGKDCS